IARPSPPWRRPSGRGEARWEEWVQRHRGLRARHRFGQEPRRHGSEKDPVAEVARREPEAVGPWGPCRAEDRKAVLRRRPETRPDARYRSLLESGNDFARKIEEAPH